MSGYNRDVIKQFTYYMGPEKQSILKSELKDRLGGRMSVINTRIEIAAKKYRLNEYQTNMLRSLRLAEGTDTFGVKGDTDPNGVKRTDQDYADVAAGTLQKRWNEWTTKQVSGSISKNPGEHQGISPEMSFIDFFSGDYTPVYRPMSIDHMNRNHMPNMRYFMKEETPESKERRVRMATSFNADSANYDYKTAREAGMKPNEQKHWGSLDSRTGMVLKGKGNTKEWDLMMEEEKRRGNSIIKKADGRYYSIQGGTR